MPENAKMTWLLVYGKDTLYFEAFLQLNDLLVMLVLELVDKVVVLLDQPT